MKRLIVQKTQNFIALYQAKGLSSALVTLLMKVFLQPLGFQRVQNLFFNLFINQEKKNIQKKIAFYGAQVSGWQYQPTISILLSASNSSLSDVQATIRSIQAQIYDKFEVVFCLHDVIFEDQTKQYLSEIASQSPRFKAHHLSAEAEEPSVLSFLLKKSSGDFFAQIDSGDQLAPQALYEIVSALNQNPDTDFIYSDDAYINKKGWLIVPFFKPDWSPDSFLSRMYIGRLAIFRRSLAESIGGFRPEYRDSQEYDLVLRLVEKTDNIVHIPKVLYFYKTDGNISLASRGFLKNKFKITELSAKTVEEALVRRNEPAKAIENEYASFVVRYEVQSQPKVSIIIPTRDLGEILDRCLYSVFTKSTYPNFEVILVDNGSQQEETFEVFNRWSQQEPDRFFVYKLDIPFNYSKLNNYAAREATGNYLLFLNNDIEVITEDWIDAMVEQAQRPSVGAVGALLLYPDNTIQHGGVVVGLGASVGGAAGHVFCNLPYGESGYFDQPNSITNYTALTAACLMCRRDVFEEVNGFEEKLAVAFNDTDLCLKIHAKGYRNVYLPHVVLYHYESKSRGRENTPEKKKRFAGEMEYLQNKWKHFIANDPSYNPNLTKERSDFSFNINLLFNQANETKQ